MKQTFLFFLLLFNFFSFAQKKIPIVKASTKQAFILDGNEGKIEWTLSPDVKPDVYTCFRTHETKWIVFHTDIDSFKVKVKPGTIVDFIVLLNGKDSCFTQIKSALTAQTARKNQINSRDTIPFTLTPYNAICVKSIINNRDTLNLHFDIGSFEFRLTKDAILKKTKLLSNQSDVLAGKSKADYNHIEKVFKIQLGNLIFNNPPLIPTNFTSEGMDGRFGWDIFEGKTVEIDYDKSIIVIHSKLPSLQKGYVKSKIKFYQSFVCVKGSFNINHKSYNGLFLLDTGSDLAIVMDSTWLNKAQFPKDLKLLKTATFKDPRGVVYENKVVLAPQFELNGFELSNIPTHLLGSSNPTRLEINFLGNDLLKRFNTILDFEKDLIYLRPNSLTNIPYKK